MISLSKPLINIISVIQKVVLSPSLDITEIKTKHLVVTIEHMDHELPTFFSYLLSEYIQ